MDGQIFAVQEYGGISRMFAELAHQFIEDPALGVSLEPLSMVTKNHYLLADPELADHLRVRPARWQHLTVARYLARPHRSTQPDLVHSTFYLTPSLRRLPQRPHVVTVHDMIPELFPDSRRRADGLTDKRRYVDQAAHIICVSESTRSDLLRIFGDVQAPITVIPHGVSPRFKRTEEKIPGLPTEYLLYVGKRSGYKDVATLVNAMPELSDAFPKLTLMLVGGGPLTPQERDRISKLGLNDRVIQRSVPDIDMPAVYSGARAFVFPSRYEGFGLPVLEAMACGTPTILARSSSLPEVGGDAAVFFDPGKPASLAAVALNLLSDSAALAAYAERARKRAAGFTWKEAARATAHVYRQTGV
ncbi:glycosyltransferase family 4 protein [bacterium]|nr:glycosyltransferase family 4 protein [bacterium]